MRSTILTTLVVLALTILVAESCHQMSMRQLYNSRITYIEVYNRPLASRRRVRRGSGNGGWHTGVVATLENGDRWLVHKGGDYGGAGGDTVVTCASNMSHRWTRQGGRRPSSSCTIGKAVGLGGTWYNLVLANCIRAKNAILNNC